jgi:peptide/nickel transport system permease protein
MKSHLLKSLLERLLLLLLVSVLAQLLVHLAPGAPTDVDADYIALRPDDVAKIRKAFHLDEPLYTQYFMWVRDLATGELRSFRDGTPVLVTIWSRFVNSLPLFVGATLFAWTLGLPFGIRAALRPKSAFDRASTALAYGLISVPGFFLSYLVIVLLSGRLGLPVLGTGTFLADRGFSASTVMDRVWHLAIPALLTAASGVAVLSRYARAQMLEVSSEDYLVAARARGLPEHVVTYRHALPNALLPFITLFGFLLPNLVGGSVVIEQIFAWPGIGRLGYEALLSRDFPMLLTLNFFAACLTLVGFLLSDWLYALADPRARRAS